MAKGQRIVILTGAGLSAESGLATFRDAGGIWAKYDYREVATPQGFLRNPALVHEFYNMRRRDLLGCAPNAAHAALARLEHEHAARNGGEVLIVTQNIDNLHEAAGSRNLINMHGELLRSLCAECGARHDIFGTGGAKQKAQELDVPFLGEVPLNTQLRIYGDQGKVASSFEVKESAPYLEALCYNLVKNLAARRQANPPLPQLSILG